LPAQIVASRFRSDSAQLAVLVLANGIVVATDCSIVAVGNSRLDRLPSGGGH
jgi:hypothetical protein